jgi:hypothetical protein
VGGKRSPQAVQKIRDPIAAMLYYGWEDLFGEMFGAKDPLEFFLS